MPHCCSAQTSSLHTLWSLQLVVSNICSIYLVGDTPLNGELFSFALCAVWNHCRCIVGGLAFHTTHFHLQIRPSVPGAVNLFLLAALWWQACGVCLCLCCFGHHCGGSPCTSSTPREWPVLQNECVSGNEAAESEGVHISTLLDVVRLLLNGFANLAPFDRVQGLSLLHLLVISMMSSFKFLPKCHLPVTLIFCFPHY